MDRRIAFAALPVLALVLASSPATAAEDAKVKVGWEGFGVGSYVHQKTTTKLSGPGMPEMPPQTTETKITLVKVTDDAFTVKSEAKSGEMDWQGTEVAIPRKGTGVEGKDEKPEDLGEEKVTVEGTEIVCKKT